MGLGGKGTGLAGYSSAPVQLGALGHGPLSISSLPLRQHGSVHTWCAAERVCASPVKTHRGQGCTLAMLKGTTA